MGSSLPRCDTTVMTLITLRTRLKGKPAKIKYHPADLSCLYVYDPFEQQYLRVPALDQEYTQGLSLVEAPRDPPGGAGRAGSGGSGGFGPGQTQDPANRRRRASSANARPRMSGSPAGTTAGKPTRLAAHQAQATEIESAANEPGASLAISLDSLATEVAGWEIRTRFSPSILSDEKKVQDG